MQISGMFDVPLDRKLTHHIEADLPVEGRDWSVGVITGPSGSGKSSLIRQLWPDAILGEQDWSAGAVVDCFPDMSIRDITAALSAVGLSTVPAWCKPYAVLSNGEKFRATVARGLAETSGLLVIDEYGAFVDVQVGKVVSVALAKAVRRAKRELIAVTCRGDDFAPWLEADWIYRVDTGELQECVQPRPRITCEIYGIDRAAWRVFAPHHYMSADLAVSAHCFGLWCDGTLAGFIAYMHQPHARVRNIKRITRTVILPDFQGCGLGSVLSDWLGQHLYEQGFRLHSVTAHPVQQRIRARSPRWREVGTKPRLQVGPRSQMRGAQLDSRRLNTRVFEYTAPKPAP